jgi:hypothetical protein
MFHFTKNRIHHYYHPSFPPAVRFSRACLDLDFVDALKRSGIETTYQIDWIVVRADYQLYKAKRELNEKGVS